VIETVYVDGQKLCADIGDNGVKRTLFFEYSDNYQPDALNADAFVIYLSRYAMLNNLDIESRVPVTPELLNSINRLLVPAMKMIYKDCCEVKIAAPYYEYEKQAEGVVTGLSCGVDSFYALLNHYRTGDTHFDVTHLLFFDNFHDINYDWETYRYCEQAAGELGLPIIKVCTNILKVLGLNWFHMHLYSLFAVVNSMQNLFARYYVGSAWDVISMSMDNALYSDPAHYELLLVKAFSHRNMELYIEGPVSRYEKTRFISNFDIVQRKLSVCWPRPYESCNICPKCVRTMVDLDALGTLDQFGEIFDLKHYAENRDWYLAFARSEAEADNDFFRISYGVLKEKGEEIPKTFEEKVLEAAVCQKQKIWNYCKNNHLHCVYMFGRAYDRLTDFMVSVFHEAGVKTYFSSTKLIDIKQFPQSDKCILINASRLGREITDNMIEEVDAMILLSMSQNLKVYKQHFDILKKGLRNSTHLSQIIEIPFFQGKEQEVEMNKVI